MASRVVLCYVRSCPGFLKLPPDSLSHKVYKCTARGVPSWKQSLFLISSPHDLPSTHCPHGSIHSLSNMPSGHEPWFHYPLISWLASRLGLFSRYLDYSSNEHGLLSIFEVGCRVLWVCPEVLKLDQILALILVSWETSRLISRVAALIQPRLCKDAPLPTSVPPFVAMCIPDHGHSDWNIIF